MASEVFFIKGLDKLQGNLKRSPELFNKSFKKAMTKALLYSHSESGKITPIDGGLLRSSTKTAVREQFSNILGVMFNNTNYASFVHDGTAKWPLSKSPKNPSTRRQFFKEVVDKKENYERFWKEAADEFLNNIAK